MKDPIGKSIRDVADTTFTVQILPNINQSLPALARLSKLEMGSVDLGQDSPVITGVNVVEGAAVNGKVPYISLDLDLKMIGDVNISVLADTKIMTKEVFIRELEVEISVRIMLETLIPEAPFYKAISMSVIKSPRVIPKVDPGGMTSKMIPQKVINNLISGSIELLLQDMSWPSAIVTDMTVPLYSLTLDNEEEGIVAAAATKAPAVDGSASASILTLVEAAPPTDDAVRWVVKNPEDAAVAQECKRLLDENRSKRSKRSPGVKSIIESLLAADGAGISQTEVDRLVGKGLAENTKQLTINEHAALSRRTGELLLRIHITGHERLPKDAVLVARTAEGVRCKQKTSTMSDAAFELIERECTEPVGQWPTREAENGVVEFVVPKFDIVVYDFVLENLLIEARSKSGETIGVIRLNLDDHDWTLREYTNMRFEQHSNKPGKARSELNPARALEAAPTLSFKLQMMPFEVDSDPKGARGGGYNPAVLSNPLAVEWTPEPIPRSVPAGSGDTKHRGGKAPAAKGTQPDIRPSSPGVRNRVSNGRLFVTVRKLSKYPMQDHDVDKDNGVALELAYGTIERCLDGIAPMERHVETNVEHTPPLVVGGTEVDYYKHFTCRVLHTSLEHQHLQLTAYRGIGKKAARAGAKGKHHAAEGDPNRFTWQFNMEDIVKHGTAGSTVVVGPDMVGGSRQRGLKVPLLEIRMVVRYVSPEPAKWFAEYHPHLYKPDAHRDAAKSAAAHVFAAAALDPKAPGSPHRRKSALAHAKEKAMRAAVEADEESQNKTVFDWITAQLEDYNLQTLSTMEHQLFTTASMVLPYWLGHCFGMGSLLAAVPSVVLMATAGYLSFSLLMVRAWLVGISDEEIANLVELYWDDDSDAATAAAAAAAEAAGGAAATAKAEPGGASHADKVARLKPYQRVLAYELEHMKHNLPPWAYYPSVEKTEWINELLFALWPQITAFVKTQIEKAVAEALDGMNIPSFLPSKLQVKRLFLDPQTPPLVTGIRSYDRASQGAQIIIDVFVSFANRTEVMVALGPLTAKFYNMAFSGVLRVVMAPLVNMLPGFGNIEISFLDVPEFTFEVDVMYFPILAIPGIDSIAKHRQT